MKVQHPTIVHFEGFTLEDFHGITLFIDYMERGTLFDFLEKEISGLFAEFIDNTIRQKILARISRGMMILHNKKVIHRDLKPENVFLDEAFNPLMACQKFSTAKIRIVNLWQDVAHMLI